MDNTSNGTKTNDSDHVKKPPRDFKNFTDAEKDVAQTVAKCLLQNIFLSVGSGYLAFRQTGNYIAAKGTPAMKSWASVVKFGAGFFTFALVRSVYGRNVCLPRVENLPPSKMRDSVLESVRGGRGPWPRKQSDQSAEQITKDSYPKIVSHDAVDSDANNHETDVGIKSFDVDKSNHASQKGKDFDHSRSYALPPDEAKSKVVRRNKYGDIIEEA